MDWERAKITAEVGYLRARSLLWTPIQIVGFLLLAIGIYRLFVLLPQVAEPTGLPPEVMAYQILPLSFGTYFDAIILTAIGAAWVWFTTGTSRL